MSSLTIAKVSDEEALLLAKVSGTISRDALMWNENPEDVLGEGFLSRVILLDASDCDRLDSAGVSWLIRLHRRTSEAGGRLILHSTPPVIAKTLKLLNMQKVLALAEDLAAARRMAESPQG
jgi:anti-anti-sigma regulatory factor